MIMLCLKQILEMKINSFFVNAHVNANIQDEKLIGLSQC